MERVDNRRAPLRIRASAGELHRRRTRTVDTARGRETRETLVGDLRSDSDHGRSGETETEEKHVRVAHEETRAESGNRADLVCAVTTCTPPLFL
jgi:hypothetical protein